MCVTKSRHPLLNYFGNSLGLGGLSSYISADTLVQLRDLSSWIIPLALFEPSARRKLMEPTSGLIKGQILALFFNPGGLRASLVNRYNPSQSASSLAFNFSNKSPRSSFAPNLAQNVLLCMRGRKSAET